MEESSQEKYQISINCECRDYLVVVDDLETSTQLVNDYNVALSYIKSNPQRCTLPADIGSEIEDVENSEVIEEVTNEEEHSTEIWTRRKPTERNLEATKILLTLRQRDFRLFDDKKTSKGKLWNEIADTLKQYGFNVGPNRGERCRQKFSNLTKSYISYVKNQTATGAERNDNIPPFYEELHSILGSKHKVNPKNLQDSLSNDSESNRDQQNDQIEETEENNTANVEERPSTSQIDKSHSQDSQNRFKKVRCRLTPQTKTELLLKHFQEDRKLQEKQFIYFQKQAEKADQHRERFLKILESAFVKKRKNNFDSESD